MEDEHGVVLDVGDHGLKHVLGLGEVALVKELQVPPLHPARAPWVESEKFVAEDQNRIFNSCFSDIHRFSLI